MKSQQIFAHLAVTSVFLAIFATPATLVASQGRAARLKSETLRSLVQLVQDDDSVPDEDAVPTDQVDKYIAVYSAMQKNHGLSVAQAASKQGLTVDQFRTLEDKIEHNPIVHERVLDALKASAHAGKTADSGSNKPE